MKKNLDNLIRVLKESFFSSYEKAGGAGFRYYHSLNVATIATKIGSNEDISDNDMQVLIVAALLHDIGKKERVDDNGFLDASRNAERKNNQILHEQLSAEFVNKKLNKYVPTLDKKQIKDVIVFSSGNKLAKILHDADDLSEMGVMNVWKMVSYSTYEHRDIQSTIDYWFNVDRDRHKEKAKKMFFKVSTGMAHKRIAETDEFFKKLQDQVTLE